MDRLRDGPISLGKGIRISALMGDDGRITFIKFTHPAADGSECTKIMPIRKKGLKWWDNFDTWNLRVNKDRTINLTPSLWCRKHDCHGSIKDGKWINFHQSLTDMSQWEVEHRIDKAIELAEAFGGGYWGALLALADKEYVPRNMSWRTDEPTDHGRTRSSWLGHGTSQERSSAPNHQ